MEVKVITQNEQKNLELKVITENQQKDWDAFVDSNPNSLICHSYKYINFVKRFYNLKLFPLACFNNGNIDGILPIFKVKTLPAREKLISVPYFVAGGAVANSMESLKHLVNHAVRLADQTNCPLLLKQYKHILPGDFNVDSNFFNQELNLSNSLENIWKNLNEENRHKIKKSESFNVSVKFPYDNVDIYYKILSTFHKIWIITTWPLLKEKRFLSGRQWFKLSKRVFLFLLVATLTTTINLRKHTCISFIGN
jgi:hypothetical protein